MQAEMEKRVTKVTELVLDGRARYEIVKIAEETWQVGENQTDKYIRKAKERLRQLNDKDIEDYRSTIIANLWVLFRDARKVRSIKEQHKILMSLAKVRGLDRQVITHEFPETRELATLSDEELDSILESAGEF